MYNFTFQFNWMVFISTCHNFTYVGGNSYCKCLFPICMSKSTTFYVSANRMVHMRPAVKNVRNSRLCLNRIKQLNINSSWFGYFELDRVTNILF